MGRYILVSVVLLLICCRTFAQMQEAYTWQDFLNAVTDDEHAEEQGWTESLEELAVIHANPLDINTATREQLLQIPFLSERQVEDIQTYIFLHRGMRSLSELMAISSIDYITRRNLSLFFYADPVVFQRKDTLNLKTIFKESHHELLTRLDIPLYYRKGYSYSPSSGGYNGNPLYHKIKYHMTSLKHVDLGVQAEKDQGEPFRGNRGWDSYGGYFMLRDIGCLRTVIAGDYRMGFGEGLVVNSGFSTGKSSLMGRPAQGIRAKRGTDEVNYFRGVATTFKFKSLSFSAWFSRRRHDASLNDDGSVKTILTSGLHRTNAELQKKNNLIGNLVGGNLLWLHKGIHLGATGYFQRFHRNLSPGDALYRAIYPRGKNFGVAGVNYGYTHPWFSVAGETAFSSENRGWATLNRVSWKASPNYTLSGSYRFYSYQYYSFYASALCENSDIQNESGAMLRLDATPVGGLTLMVYADFFYNPWPRYSMTRSSKGQEFTTNMEYSWNRHNKIAARYQLKRKEKSDRMQLHNRLRLQYARQFGEYWTLQSMLNLHTVDGTAGYAFSGRVRYRQSQGQVSAMLSYFHAPNYDARIYAYEPMLTEMFRYPSIYGCGYRLAVAAQYRLWKERIALELLYGMTRYTDRDVQSSGMQEIRSPWKNDISVQVRLRI